MKNLSIKTVTLIVVLSFNINAKATDYQYFVKTIKKSCTGTKSLLVKKTYLGFIRNKSTCSNTFAQRLLKTCSKISCKDLITTYNTSNERESGNVIGRAY